MTIRNCIYCYPCAHLKLCSIQCTHMLLYDIKKPILILIKLIKVGPHSLMIIMGLNFGIQIIKTGGYTKLLIKKSIPQNTINKTRVI